MSSRSRPLPSAGQDRRQLSGGFSVCVCSWQNVKIPISFLPTLSRISSLTPSLGSAFLVLYTRSISRMYSQLNFEPDNDHTGPIRFPQYIYKIASFPYFPLSASTEPIAYDNLIRYLKAWYMVLLLYITRTRSKSFNQSVRSNPYELTYRSLQLLCPFVRNSG